MSETIEVSVGALYAQMHKQYSEELGEQYDQRVRQEIEDFLHSLNQQVERQQEAVLAEQGHDEIELPEADEE